MLIGINASAAFKQPRTGVEEYTYQLVKHLTMLEKNSRYRFVLYSQGAGGQGTVLKGQSFRDSPLIMKQLKWPLPMWTQVRLSTEMAINKPDVLFIPVHVLPLVHPQNSVVTIHGLEYEYYPEMYPWRHLRYLRWSTKYALKNARKIIAVSENTKKDLIELYGGEPEKIEVIYHGVEQGLSFKDNPALKGQSLKLPYILFIGRLETKKNIQGLIEAFNLLKEKYQVPHRLVLVGPIPMSDKGLTLQVATLKRSRLRGRTFKVVKRSDLEILGYVSEQEKWQLLKKADLFVLPSFYEGFGIPILEAQAAGCPVITSNVSSMPEVAGDGAVLIDPKNIEQIAQGIYQVISDENFKKELIQKGYKNVKRFSWQKCARRTFKVLTE